MEVGVVLDVLEKLGSFAGGTAAVVALAAGFGALKDWERKRARDRRAEVATRIIRRVALASEELSAAILAPSMRLVWAEVTGKHEVQPVAVNGSVVLAEFDDRMRRALEQVRELYMLHVEARVHLEADEVHVLGQFLAASQQAEQAARSAVVAAEDDLSSPDVRKTLTARLTRTNDRTIDAREDVVRLLGPVARDGRRASYPDRH